MCRNILKSNPRLLLYGGVLKHTCYSYANLWLPAANFIVTYYCFCSRIYSPCWGWPKLRGSSYRPSLPTPMKILMTCSILIILSDYHVKIEMVLKKKPFHFQGKVECQRTDEVCVGTWAIITFVYLLLCFLQQDETRCSFLHIFSHPFSNSCYSHHIMKCGFLTLVPLRALNLCANVKHV